MYRCKTCNCEVCKCDRLPSVTKIKNLTKENARFRSALTEIRDVAAISEGVEFYAMLADQALKGE
jgi:hypothetical protein